MNLLPGWDSIESAGFWSHFWFWFGIACLFALGASEVVSHYYGVRKDELVAIAAESAEVRRKADADAAEARRRAEVATLQGRLAEADKKVAGLQSQNIARRLSSEDKQALIKDLSNSPGQKAEVFVATSAWDGSEYGKDFLSVFKGAKWDVPDAPSYGIVVGGDVIGVHIVVNPRVISEPQKVSGEFADSINYLARHLVRLGQMPTPTVQHDGNIEYGKLQLKVGRIPPPN